MKGAQLYFHAPCFDGLISAVVARRYLEVNRDWKFTEIVPVTYTGGDEAVWAGSQLSDRSAVVDFLYHPQAAFWVDHHDTAFKVPGSRVHYESELANGNRTLIYDGDASPAGAYSLWQRVADHMPDAERYSEMVRWAKVTDSAAYATVEEAIFGDEPALRIARTLGKTIELERLRTLIDALGTGTLAEVAASDVVAIPFARAREQTEAGLEIIDRRMQLQFNGIVASYEASTSSTDCLPRYGAFLLERKIRYSVSLVHDERGSKISASRNPWGKPTCASLGRILERYGGGGHVGVGSLQYPPGRAAEARSTFNHVIRDICAAETAGDCSAGDVAS